MNYDVIIIGAGPSGLMAAIRAGESGARVLLVEKNHRPGVKLLITGGGRCNLTNNLTDAKLLASRFGPKGKFLISAFNKFGASEVIDFFESRGLRLKTEKNNQVFPQSDKAADVLKVLLDEVKRKEVEIRLNAEVKEIIAKNGKIEKIILVDGEEIKAQNYIMSTGGKSYPSTGSSGSGYEWLRQLGHTILPLRPALTPILVKEKFIRELQGLSLNNAGISLWNSNKKLASVIGDIIFTSSGLSGPAVLDLSRFVGTESVSGLIVELDFFPEIDAAQFDKKLQSILVKNGKKLFSNSLAGLIPSRLTPVILKLLSINADRQSSAITKTERMALIKIFMHFKLTFKALEDFDKAMVTAGGVSLKQIDPRTMRSKLVNNLFIAGELLDIDGPTGGYNLQAAWSTGYVAGESAAEESL